MSGRSRRRRSESERPVCRIHREVQNAPCHKCKVMHHQAELHAFVEDMWAEFTVSDSLQDSEENEFELS